MKEEDRQSMIDHHRSKAHHLLEQASQMIELGHWDIAVNRFYYACFHIVHSLFMSRGIVAHTHSGTLSQFTLHIVKTGLIPIEYGAFFSRLVQLRQKADYNSISDITEQDAKDIVHMANDFITKVENLISSFSSQI